MSKMKIKSRTKVQKRNVESIINDGEFNLTSENAIKSAKKRTDVYGPFDNLEDLFKELNS